MSNIKVLVQDANNVLLEVTPVPLQQIAISRGVAGRGISDVQAIEIDNALYLEFFFTDGTTEIVGPVGTIQYIGQSPIVVNASTISLTTVPINLGGTNATTASGARTNLGLGTIATQDASAVAITGGSITGITDLAVADGGTGASTAADARTNLGAAASATTISAGTGLTGGGDLTANRTLAIANTAVTAGSYGSASNTLTTTVNAQGQLTALAATPIAIANTQVSGLGTMSTQNSNSVTITGGSITGITDLAIADGGTGASTASGARSNLGLGTAAVLDAGVANGVATLDAGGTVPLSQIPASIQGGVSYQGAWNAATNTPTLTSSVGSKGYYYVVSVSGSTNLNGVTDWLVGDWAIFNGSIWQKIDNTDQVASVNGYTGVVVLTNTDVGAPPTSLTISAGTGLTGGGDLSTNRTLSIANTTVAAASYGSASAVPTFTVNGQGQLTAASNTTIAIANTQVSGLGTMSTQNANSVAITGGSITGITDLAIADGGTGASTANGALSNLGGIGTITSTDGSIVVTPAGTTVDLAVSAASPASTLLTQVRNTTGATLTKGTVVYISGATGQIATVSKAIATGDSTSAQTLGMITSDLPNNTNGYVTVFGLIENINTSAYTDGAQLYLSGTTAGTVTATKPSAPIHLVYVAVVEYAHPTQGKLLVKVQNGYELDEIHDVQIVSPVTGQTIVYNSATSLWQNNTVSLTAGVNGILPVTNGGTGVTTSTGSGSVVLSTSPTLVTPVLGTPTSVTLTNATGLPLTTGVTGTLPIANGGTGQTTANAAFNALAPSQTGNSGKYLTTDGSNTSWATNPLGTVTSIDVSGGTTGLTTSGGPITTSGTITLAGTLATTNGGTGRTAYTANSVLYASSTSAIASGTALTFDGTNLNIGTATSVTNRLLNVQGSAVAKPVLVQTTTTNALIEFNDSSTASKPAMGSVGDALTFWPAGIEGMRLTSTGLGIGTNSPSNKLVVSNAGANGLEFNPTNGQIVTYNRSTSAYTALTLSGLSFIVQTGASPADRLTVDSAGNVGIGTSSPAIKLDISGTAQTLFKLTTTNTEANINFNINSSTNNFFGITGGANFFWNTGSTERMRLDNAGNLGIGTSSPSSRLHTSVAGENVLTVQSTATTTGTTRLRLYSATATTPYDWYVQGDSASGTLRFYNAQVGSEAGRFDTSNNFLIGTTTNTNTSKLVVNGTISQTVGGTQYLVVDQSDIGTGANEIPLNQYLGALAYQDNVSLTTNDIAGVLPTANGGTGRSSYTANSVLYASSTSAIASGSALTFDGVDTLSVANVVGTGKFGLYSEGTGVAFGGIGTTNYLRFLVTNTEQMRLTSTGLGIGTNSLVAGTKLTLQESASSPTALALLNRNSTQTWKIAVDASAVDDKILAFIDNATSTVRMALTDTGNLGIGTTPSAWGSGIKSLQVGNYSALTNNQGGYTWLSNNAYYDTGWKYLTLNKALYYAQDTGDGGHKWFNAASGSANTAISFNQAMTLFASGGLSVGLTSDPGVGAISARSSTAAHSFDSTSGTEVIAISKANGNRAYLATVSSTDAGLQVKDSGGAVNLTVGTSGKSVALQGGTVSTGTGIAFPATQNASSDANTLDDYEEGTWTPTVYIGETSNSIATASGTYTKIGNVVFFACRAESVTKSGTGGLTIRNLPFAASSSGNQNRYAQQLVRWTGINPGGVVIGLADAGASSISFQFFTTTGGYGGAVSDSQISASFSLYGVSGFYYTT